MSSRRHTNRGIAAFVLMFLCLNVGGALCLTLCTQIFAASEIADSDAHLSEHCKQAKKAAEELERNATKIEAGEASCCIMPVSMFAAPLEKRSEIKLTLTAAPLPASVEHEFAAPEFYRASLPATPVYRPPPLDGRSSHVINSVFRI